MKFRHRIFMLLGLGPKFFMAEPGTDPLNEPELFKTRRRRGFNWLPFALGLLATAAAWAGWWLNQAR
jgi:hypothetical protein